VDAWAPVFAVSLGIPRGQMDDLSVPQMVDHLDYWHDTMKGGPDG
jgi:hypothetical protein